MSWTAWPAAAELIGLGWAGPAGYWAGLRRLRPRQDPRPDHSPDHSPRRDPSPARRSPEPPSPRADPPEQAPVPTGYR